MSQWRLLWRELRLVLRLRWARWLLCASISLSVLGSIVLWGSVARASHALLVHCSDEESRAFLDMLVGSACVFVWQGEYCGTTVFPAVQRLHEWPGDG